MPRDLAGQTLTLKELQVKHMVSAFDIAKAGGKHAGFLRERLGYTDAQLARAEHTTANTLADHQRWIEDPFSKLPKDYPPVKVEHLRKTKWPADVKRLLEQLEILGQIRARRGGK